MKIPLRSGKMLHQMYEIHSVCPMHSLIRSFRHPSIQAFELWDNENVMLANERSGNVYSLTLAMLILFQMLSLQNILMNELDPCDGVQHLDVHATVMQHNKQPMQGLLASEEDGNMNLKKSTNSKKLPTSFVSPNILHMNALICINIYR